MILTVDLGNTRLSMALVERGRATRHVVLDYERSGAALARALRAIGAARAAAKPNYRGAVIASVVPNETGRVERAVAKATGARVWRFPRDLDGDLRVAPKPKNRVGADRLANAIGALELAGSRARDLVVVDVGTAVTVDVVTRRCEFVGGMIAPGPRLLSRALAEFTAQLPKIPFGETRRPIGRNTKEAIEAGLWFGSRGLVAGLVRAALAARPGARVLVAGGDGARCLAKSGIPYELVPGLTHIGLAGALLRRLGEP